MRQCFEFAIIGAGPAGLAAALFLSRQGHKVTIFEQFDRPAPIGSGLLLQPTGMTVLHDLGCLDAVLGLGNRIDRLYGVETRSNRTVLDVHYSAFRKSRFGLAINRSALFDVLYDQVKQAGIVIETGFRTSQLNYNGSKVQPVGNSSQVPGDFDCIIDASGANSTLKQYSQNPGRQRALEYGALWTTLKWVEGDFALNALSQRYERANIMIGILPSGTTFDNPHPAATFFWSIKPRDYHQVRQSGLEKWKDKVLGYWPECDVFIEQIESFDQLALAQYGHHTMTTPAGNRIAFIGDAAHSTSPQLGQGANMALLDAYALGQAFSQSHTLDQALLSYCRMRRWHVRIFQALSYLFTPMYQSNSSILPFLRDQIIPVAARFPPTHKLMASMVAGTLLNPFPALGIEETDWNKARVDA